MGENIILITMFVESLFCVYAIIRCEWVGIKWLASERIQFNGYLSSQTEPSLSKIYGELVYGHGFWRWDFDRCLDDLGIDK